MATPKNWDFGTFRKFLLNSQSTSPLFPSPPRPPTVNPQTLIKVSLGESLLSVDPLLKGK